MTQEEKKLLLADLCARLPYGTVIHTDYKDIKLDTDHCGIGVLYYKHYSEEAKKQCGYNEKDFVIIISGCYYGDIKPYLRPLFSMSEEEKEIYRCLSVTRSEEDLVIPSPLAMQWLLSRHFDINHLIEKELALIAPEGMY